jgi:hypothetical protein
VLRGCTETDVHVRIVRRIADIRIEDSRFIGIAVIATHFESLILSKPYHVVFSYIYFACTSMTVILLTIFLLSA